MLFEKKVLGGHEEKSTEKIPFSGRLGCCFVPTVRYSMAGDCGIETSAMAQLSTPPG